jgi:hypothetical protein
VIVRPANPLATDLAAIAGTLTLTREALMVAQRMGYCRKLITRVLREHGVAIRPPGFHASHPGRAHD